MVDGIVAPVARPATARARGLTTVLSNEAAVAAEHINRKVVTARVIGQCLMLVWFAIKTVGTLGLCRVATITERRHGERGTHDALTDWRMAYRRALARMQAAMASCVR